MNRLVACYERTRRPGLVLLALVFLVHSRSLSWGFVLDDCRHLHVMEQYHHGERDSLQLYRFLQGEEGNTKVREAGTYPWWISNDLRYLHWRPVSEWLLYGQYLVLGRNPFGYHAVSLVLYAAGCAVVLYFFRVIGGHERPARWGALAFALLAGHAIPVVFISAQCDVIALLLGGGAMCFAARYVGESRAGDLFLASAGYVLALGAKEACLPLAVLPATFAWIQWRRPGGRRRALKATVCLSSLGLIWFALYIAGGFGSNNTVMLNPIQAPLDFLARMPGRAVILLTSLLVPINPFVFYLRPEGAPWLWLYCAAGVVALGGFAILVWRRLRGERGVASMALWAVPFLPLLACTVPDDRVMVLPGIGLAFLLGAWMTTPRPATSLRLRPLPMMLVAINAICGLAAAQILRNVEKDKTAPFREIVAQSDRPLRPNEFIFFVNETRDWRILFAQPCLREFTNVPGARAAHLCDVEDPIVTRPDQYTLCLRASADSFFTGFLGRMAGSRERPKQEGDVFAAGELTGRILEVSNGEVRAVEIEFRRPLECDAYRFFWTDADGRISKWTIPPVRRFVSVAESG